MEHTVDPSRAQPVAVPEPSRLRFGEFEIDREAVELRRGGERVELAPQAVRALAILAARQGELVRREELYRALWTGAVVDVDRGLNTLIRQIRLALNDDPARPRYLRTYPRRGYRFLARLESPASLPAADGRRGRGGGRGAPIATVAALCGMLGVAFMLLKAAPGTAAAPPPAIRDTFLMARHLLLEGDLSRRAEAIPLLEAVVRGAPGFGPGHARLAEALFWGDRWSEARVAARSALRLDPSEPTALLIEGSLALMRDWNWAGAESLVQRAVRRAPEDPAVRAGRAFILITAGRTEQAVVELRQAERADPVAAWLVADLGLMYLYAGELRAAATACERAIRLEPRAVHSVDCALSARLGLGDTAAALVHAGRLARALGADPANIPGEAARSQLNAIQRFSSWRADRAREVLRSDPRAAFAAALVFARAGREDEALAALAQAARQRDPGFVTVTVDPRLAPLRADPGYRLLIAPVVAAGAGNPPQPLAGKGLHRAKISRTKAGPIESSSRIH